MGVKSNTLQQQVLDYIFGLGADGPVETNFFIALHIVAPSTAGTGGTEVSGGGYARQSTTPDTDYTRTGQTVTNDNDIDFGTAGAAWGNVVAVTIWDAITAGNLVYVKTLAAPRNIASGDPVKFNAGDLIFSEA